MTNASVELDDQRGDTNRYCFAETAIKLLHTIQNDDAHRRRDVQMWLTRPPISHQVPAQMNVGDGHISSR